MGRTFVMADIHGGFLALQQCLERSGFNKETDTLIQLGDIVDGWPETYECVEELLTIKNLISIQGNHDEWFKDWLFKGVSNSAWEMHGGSATKDSYIANFGITQKSHKDFWSRQVPYYLDSENRLFVHGGFNRHYPLEDQSDFVFCWDRDLWLQALSHSRMVIDTQNKYPFKMVGDFKEVYIGHTPVTHWGSTEPMHAANGVIWNLDTGAAFKGKLTIMDIDTKEFWQSDSVYTLYPNDKGRN